MKSLKNAIQILGLILLLAAAVALVWYLVYHAQVRLDTPDGVLVERTVRRLVRL